MSTVTERWTESRGTAMHEAGHAVVAFELGRAFTSVSIIPDKDTLGRVHRPQPGHWFKPDIGVTGRGRVLIEDRIMILLAGFAAEDAWCRTVSGKHRDWRKLLRDGASTDSQLILDFAYYISSSYRETAAHIERLNQRVLTLVGPEGAAAPLVYRFADELEKTRELSWRKAKTFMTAAKSEAGNH